MKNSWTSETEKEKAVKARKILEIAKNVEAEKIKKGFIWIIKGKECKLVNPEKINIYKDSGWEIIKKSKKL